MWGVLLVTLAADVDVVVYGGTSAGVAAAVQTAQLGKSVALIEPGRHIGGMTTAGLGFTDSGDKNVVGGFAREFYRRIKRHYDDPSAWIFEKRDASRLYRPTEDAMWTFEPRVAEQVLLTMLNEAKVTAVFNEQLDRRPGLGVKRSGARIQQITMKSGKAFTGKMFIDATYEGDLMAAAGVSCVVGRESNRQFGETLNGVQRRLNTHNHRFVVDVDPYRKPGDPRSGVLPGIGEPLPTEDGVGDHRIQAYCFRMCLTDASANRVPFVRPADYSEADYELLFRNFEAGDLRVPFKPDWMPNRKTDVNNNCAVSTDFIGQNFSYPLADDDARVKIVVRHLRYQQGLMWSLAHHPRVPKSVRDQVARFGPAKDEFVDSDFWPHQIYVREARRMVSDYVMTEMDCRRRRTTPEPVGMGSYNMDSHNCERYITERGFVQNEGDVQESPGGPYQISYRSIVPKKQECENLLAPVCLSATHIAYGSIRMEPVFFVLGQSSAFAAGLAIDGNVAVQQVAYTELARRLRSVGQVLEYTPQPKRPTKKIEKPPSKKVNPTSLHQTF